MAFSVQSKKSGKTYFLHRRLQQLKGGREVTLYYFAGVAGEAAIDALPATLYPRTSAPGYPFSRRVDFAPRATGMLTGDNTPRKR